MGVTKGASIALNLEVDFSPKPEQSPGAIAGAEFAEQFLVAAVESSLDSGHRETQLKNAQIGKSAPHGSQLFADKRKTLALLASKRLCVLFDRSVSLDSHAAADDQSIEHEQKHGSADRCEEPSRFALGVPSHGATDGVGQESPGDTQKCRHNEPAWITPRHEEFRHDAD
jgi:hypothetical protein